MFQVVLLAARLIMPLALVAGDVGIAGGVIPKDPSRNYSTSVVMMSGYGGPKRAGVTYELLDIRPNSSPTARFIISNAGTDTLQIKDMLKCCGVVTRLDKDTVLPGQEAQLEVQLYAGSTAGLITRKIILLTNDPNRPQLELTITGRVIETLSWSPSSIQITKGRPIGHPRISICSKDGITFSIRSLTASADIIHCQVDPASKASRFELVCAVDPDKLAGYDLDQAGIRIELDHPDYKVIEIPVRIIPALELEAIPSHILAFGLDPNVVITRAVRLIDHQHDPNQGLVLKVRSLATDKGTAVRLVSARQLADGLELRLELGPIEADTDSAMLSDRLTVRLTDGRDLQIPIRIFTKRSGLIR